MLSAAFASPELWPIVRLSLSVSLAATAAAALGLPFGAALAVWRFPGRQLLVVFANALLGLPPAVVGLALYLLLSHSGSLGALGLLFTPAAMVVAQAILALPIVTALAHRTAEDLWTAFGDALMDLGASRRRAVPVLIAMGRLGMLTAVLAGLGRTMSEVGAILVVGGNIAGYTRTHVLAHGTGQALDTARRGGASITERRRYSSWPPSTEMVWPVTQPASGDTRNATT